MRFRDFEVLQPQRVLLVHGEPVAVGSRAFDVLVALATRAGRIVGKAELFEAAWPGLVVEENNLTVQVSGLRKLLGASAIRTVAGVGYQLNAVAAATEATGAASSVARRRRAPAPVPLLGREDDESVLASRLATSRLVSIVGAGGVGKTALAKALIARIDDVEWIDLAPLQDEAQVAPFIATRLGIVPGAAGDPVDDLMHALADMKRLVVLDNCEHVLDAVAQIVGGALDHAADVRWLTTSRESLRVHGELIYRLQPLVVPSAGPPPTPADAMRCGAVALMCERIASGDHRFVLTPANVGQVIDLCARLDGLPLAIEMAAARVTTLGLTAVHEQLDRRFPDLTGPRDGPVRQQTLRSTFDWSYGLLSPDERRCFRRLQPFVGGFGIRMAAMVTASGNDAASLDEAMASVAKLLHALVNKSLVQRSIDGDLRFFLQESARHYGLERLVAEGEANEVARRHAMAVADFFDPARGDQERLGDVQWQRVYVVERHNLRAALAHVCDMTDADARDPDLLARLVAAFASLDLFLREGCEILNLDIPLDILREASPAVRGNACLRLGWAHFTEGSRKCSAELTKVALADLEAIGDVPGIYRALAQSIRLFQVGQGGDARTAEAAWDRLQGIDSAAVPLGVRLFCETTTGPRDSTRITAERLRHWETLARSAGLDSIAASCAVYASDELLIERRFEEALAIVEQFLAVQASRPVFVGVMHLNQTLALVRLGRSDEAWAAARSMMRVLPRRCHLAFVSLALDAVRGGRFAEAAMMVGHYQHVLADRTETLDAAEAEADAETRATLAGAVPHAALREWMMAGSAMRPADFVARRDDDARTVAVAFRPTRDARRESAPDRSSSRD